MANPVLVATAAQTAQKIFTSKTFKIVLILVILLFFFRKRVKAIVKKRKVKKFGKTEFQDPSIIAQQYRAAANPTGIDWMINFDGTDEVAIEKLAFQSKGDNLESISDAYQARFSEPLTDRLRRELSNEEFQEWNNIVT